VGFGLFAYGVSEKTVALRLGRLDRFILALIAQGLSVFDVFAFQSASKECYQAVAVRFKKSAPPDPFVSDLVSVCGLKHDNEQQNPHLGPGRVWWEQYRYLVFTLGEEANKVALLTKKGLAWYFNYRAYGLSLDLLILYYPLIDDDAKLLEAWIKRTVDDPWVSWGDWLEQSRVCPQPKGPPSAPKEGIDRKLH
jgi:hypothetical protein